MAMDCFGLKSETMHMQEQLGNHNECREGFYSSKKKDQKQIVNCRSIISGDDRWLLRSSLVQPRRIWACYSLRG